MKLKNKTITIVIIGILFVLILSLGVINFQSKYDIYGETSFGKVFTLNPTMFFAITEELNCRIYQNYDTCARYNFYTEPTDPVYINADIELGTTLSGNILKVACTGDEVRYAVTDSRNNPIDCDENGCDGGYFILRSGNTGTVQLNYDKLTANLNPDVPHYLYINCWDFELEEGEWLYGGVQIYYTPLPDMTTIAKDNCFSQAECSEGYRCVLNTGSEPKVNRDYVASTEDWYTCQPDSDGDGIIDQVQIITEQLPENIVETTNVSVSDEEQPIKIITDEVKTKTLTSRFINAVNDIKVWFKNLFN